MRPLTDYWASSCVYLTVSKKEVRRIQKAAACVATARRRMPKRWRSEREDAPAFAFDSLHLKIIVMNILFAFITLLYHTSRWRWCRDHSNHWAGNILGGERGWWGEGGQTLYPAIWMVSVGGVRQDLDSAAAAAPEIWQTWLSWLLSSGLLSSWFLSTWSLPPWLLSTWWGLCWAPGHLNNQSAGLYQKWSTSMGCLKFQEKRDHVL